MKSYDPYPMMVRFKEHAGITKGETIQETIGGRLVRFKVTQIQSIKTLENGVQEVILMVRELPGGDDDEKE
jgi:hypothetical protein